MPIQVIFICAAMLLVAIAPMPYGYYILLRLVSCGVFAYAAFIAHERKLELLPWIYGLLALLFNPIIKVHFDKEIWAFIDIAAAIILLISVPKIAGVNR